MLGFGSVALREQCWLFLSRTLDSTAIARPDVIRTDVIGVSQEDQEGRRTREQGTRGLNAKTRSSESGKHQYCGWSVMVSSPGGLHMQDLGL